MRGESGRWLLGLGMVLALLLVHIGLWRPARDALVEHIAYPIAAAVETPRADGITLTLSPRTITAVETATGREALWRSPANLGYLVVALVLIAVFPRRPYWFWLWLAHLALGLVGFGAFVLGVGWTEVGFEIGAIVRDYLAQALSLLALVVAFAPGVTRRAA